MATLPWFDFSKHNVNTTENVRAFSVNHPQAGRLIVFKGVEALYHQGMTDLGMTQTRDGSWVIPASQVKPSNVAKLYPHMGLTETSLERIDLTKEFLSTPNKKETAAPVPAETSTIGMHPVITWLNNNARGDEQGVRTYDGAIPAYLSGSLYRYLSQNAEVIESSSGITHYLMETSERFIRVDSLPTPFQSKPKVIFYSASSKDLVPKVEQSKTPMLFDITDSVLESLDTSKSWYFSLQGDRTETPTLDAGIFLRPDAAIEEAAIRSRIERDEKPETLVAAKVSLGNSIVIASKPFSTHVLASEVEAIVDRSYYEKLVASLPIDQESNDPINVAALLDNEIFVDSLKDRGFSSVLHYQFEPHSAETEDNGYLNEEGVGLRVTPLTDESIEVLDAQIVRKPLEVPEGFSIVKGGGRYKNKVGIVFDATGTRLSSLPFERNSPQNTTWFADGYAAVESIADNQKQWEADKLLAAEIDAIKLRLADDAPVSSDEIAKISDEKSLTRARTTKLIREVFGLTAKEAKPYIDSAPKVSADSEDPRYDASEVISHTHDTRVALLSSEPAASPELTEEGNAPRPNEGVEETPAESSIRVDEADVLRMSAETSEESIVEALDEGKKIQDPYGNRIWISETKANGFLVNNQRDASPFVVKNGGDPRGNGYTRSEATLAALDSLLPIQDRIAEKREEAEQLKTDTLVSASTPNVPTARDELTDDMFAEDFELDDVEVSEKLAAAEVAITSESMPEARIEKGNSDRHIHVTGAAIDLFRDELEDHGGKYIKTHNAIRFSKSDESRARSVLALLSAAEQVSVVDLIRRPFALAVDSEFEHGGKQFLVTKIERSNVTNNLRVVVSSSPSSEIVMLNYNLSVDDLADKFDLEIINFDELQETLSTSPSLALVDTAYSEDIDIEEPEGEEDNYRAFMGSVLERIGKNANGNTVFVTPHNNRAIELEDGTFDFEPPFPLENGEFTSPKRREDAFLTAQEYTQLSSTIGSNVVSIFDGSIEDDIAPITREEFEALLQEAGIDEGLLSAAIRAQVQLNNAITDNSDRFTINRLTQTRNVELLALQDNLAESGKTISLSSLVGLAEKSQDFSDPAAEKLATAISIYATNSKQLNTFEDQNLAFLISLNPNTARYIDAATILDFTDRYQRLGMAKHYALLISKCYGNETEQQTAIDLALIEDQSADERTAKFVQSLDDKYSVVRRSVEIPAQIARLKILIGNETSISPLPNNNRNTAIGRLVEELALLGSDIDAIEITEQDIEDYRTLGSHTEIVHAIADRYDLPSSAANKYIDRISEHLTALNLEHKMSTPEYSRSQEIQSALAGTPFVDNRKSSVGVGEAPSLGVDTIFSIPWGSGYLKVGELEAVSDTEAGPHSLYQGNYRIFVTYNDRNSLRESESTYLSYANLPSTDLAIRDIQAFASQFRTTLDIRNAPAYGQKLDELGDSYNTTEIAKSIRKDIAQAVKSGDLPQGLKVSVRKGSGHGSIYVTIKSLPEDLQYYTKEWADYYEDQRKRNWPHDVDRPRYTLTAEGAALRNAVEGYMDAYNYNRSDSYQDIFDYNYYSDLTIEGELEQTLRERALNTPSPIEQTSSLRDDLVNTDGAQAIYYGILNNHIWSSEDAVRRIIPTFGSSNESGIFVDDRENTMFFPIDETNKSETLARLSKWAATDDERYLEENQEASFENENNDNEVVWPVQKLRKELFSTAELYGLGQKVYGRDFFSARYEGNDKAEPMFIQRNEHGLQFFIDDYEKAVFTVSRDGKVSSPSDTESDRLITRLDTEWNVHGQISTNLDIGEEKTGYVVEQYPESNKPVEASVELLVESQKHSDVEFYSLPFLSSNGFYIGLNESNQRFNVFVAGDIQSRGQSGFILDALGYASKDDAITATIEALEEYLRPAIENQHPESLILGSLALYELEARANNRSLTTSNVIDDLRPVLSKSSSEIEKAYNTLRENFNALEFEGDKSPLLSWSFSIDGSQSSRNEVIELRQASNGRWDSSLTMGDESYSATLRFDNDAELYPAAEDALNKAIDRLSSNKNILRSLISASIIDQASQAGIELDEEQITLAIAENESSPSSQDFGISQITSREIVQENSGSVFYMIEVPASIGGDEFRKISELAESSGGTLLDVTELPSSFCFATEEKAYSFAHKIGANVVEGRPHDALLPSPLETNTEFLNFDIVSKLESLGYIRGIDSPNTFVHSTNKARLTTATVFQTFGSDELEITLKVFPKGREISVTDNSLKMSDPLDKFETAIADFLRENDGSSLDRDEVDSSTKRHANSREAISVLLGAGISLTSREGSYEVHGNSFPYRGVIKSLGGKFVPKTATKKPYWSFKHDPILALSLAVSRRSQERAQVEYDYGEYNLTFNYNNSSYTIEARHGKSDKSVTLSETDTMMSLRTNLQLLEIQNIADIWQEKTGETNERNDSKSNTEPSISNGIRKRATTGDDELERELVQGTDYGKPDSLYEESGELSRPSGDKSRVELTGIANQQLPKESQIASDYTDASERESPSYDEPNSGVSSVTRFFNLRESIENKEYTSAQIIKSTNEAIKTLVTLREESRKATPAEQDKLALFTGLGAGLFNKGSSSVFSGHSSIYARDPNYELRKTVNALPKELRESLNESILTAFLTPEEISSFMWDAVQRLGLDPKTPHRILDPAFGTGNYTGYAPLDVRKNSRILGIEKDIATSQIAAELYPEAQVINNSFENSLITGSSQDLVIGNPPYGDVRVVDKISGNRRLIHDYFLEEGIRTLKPGGILTYVTSSGTLDKMDNRSRVRVYQEADLLHAYRLPNTAFKREADTEVITDILFFRKRKPEDQPLDPSWLSSRTMELEAQTGNLQGQSVELPVNDYYSRNPDNILGTLVAGSGKFGPEVSVVPDDSKTLQQLFSEKLSDFELGAYSPERAFRDLDQTGTGKSYLNAVGINDEIIQKNSIGSIFVHDGKVLTLAFDGTDQAYFGQPLKINKKSESILLDYTVLRDSAKLLLESEKAPNTMEASVFVEKQRVRLNSLYEKFVAKHGCIGSNAVRKLCRRDPDFYFTAALENYNRSADTATKSDILKRRVIGSEVTPEIETHHDALILSISRTGSIDPNFVSEIRGIPWDEIYESEKDQIFVEPVTGEFQIQHQYLVGDIGRKLEVAELAAASDNSYQRNVKALKDALPTPIDLSDIHIRIGATWIDDSVYTDFLRDKYGATSYSQKPKCYAKYIPETGRWKVHITPQIKNSSSKLEQVDLGTEELPFSAIFLLSLEGKKPRITIKNNDGTTVVNPVSTAEAKRKQKEIETEFYSWIVSDPERAKVVVDSYNKHFNRWVEPQFPGNLLNFEGMSKSLKGKPFVFHKHQPPVIERALLSDTGTLFAHEAGAGKTIELCCTAVKGKEMGVWNKPITAVPNHMLVQFTNDTLDLYPNARVLSISKDDTRPENRALFANKVLLNDWDSIICTHDTFKKLSMSAEYTEQYLNIELDIYRDALDEAKANGDRLSEKEMMRAIKNLESKIESQLHKLQSKQDNINFDDLGIDGVLYDEAHYLKNYSFPSRQSGLAGVNAVTSARALDAMMKFDYIRETRTDQKGVVLATGTPIANSVGELYVMVRYLAPEILEKAKLQHFDAFLAAFGEVRTALEMKPDGNGYQMKERLSKFHNVPELIRLFRLVADIKTGSDLDIPKPNTEKIYHTADQSDDLREFMDWLAVRSQICASGGNDPTIDNKLVISNHGRLASIDLRLLDPTLPDFKNSKVNLAVENVHSLWEEHKSERRTQLVFLDQGVPSGKQFDLYEDMKNKWIERGVPSSEIAFIHDAKNDDEKEELFSKVRSGEIRILIASTLKAGVGTNVQTLASDLHHIDIPWRAIDLEQRNKRFDRQGCLFENVNLHYYTTKDSFDLFSLNTVERKEKMTSQAMSSPEKAARTLDEEIELTYSELIGITTGNKIIAEKVEVDTKVQELELAKSAFLQQRGRAAHRASEQSVLVERKTIEMQDAEATRKTFTPTDHFSMTVDGQGYNKHKAAGIALSRAANRMSAFNNEMTVGTFCGFLIKIIRDSAGAYFVHLDSPSEISQEMNTNLAGFVSQLERKLKATVQNVELIETEIVGIQAELDELKVLASSEFDRESELQELCQQQTAIDVEVQSLTSNKDKDADYGLFDHPFAQRIDYQQSVERRHAEKNEKMERSTRVLVTQNKDRVLSNEELDKLDFDTELEKGNSKRPAHDSDSGSLIRVH